ncbi:MAG: hypothetical protein NPMRTH1_1550022 [Nitrosopumilales archaeon]|nr:MAG: hypothetical protein NPMRTH1_1550022 [Nitrosopumilales archaeon]
MVDQEIRSLLQDIELERTVLPEIQREFVWSEQKARDLVDSLYKKFPIGVILLWRPQSTQDFRLLEGQEGKDRQPDWLILDGQQRLTSLGQIKKGEIKILFHIDDEIFSVENRARAADPKWLRVDDIWEKGSASILQELSNSLGLSMDQVYKNYVKKIQAMEEILSQKIPVFEVREEDYSRIAEMYMRLNEKGTKLRKAEINLALIVLKFPKIFYNRLTKLVEEFEGWELDTNFFLRCFVCVSTNQSKYEPLKKYLSTSTQDEILSNLEKISEHLNNTFNFITSNFGINEDNNLKLIPSEMVLISLMMYFIKTDGKIPTSVDLEKLILWFFSASHYGRYSGTTESVLNEDLRALKNPDPVTIWLAAIQKERGSLEMRELPSRINSTNLFALYYALRTNNALDWWTGNSLSSTPNIEFHHIFPKRVLRDAGYPDNQINHICNIAIVSRKANRTISAMKPEEYFETIIQDKNRLYSQFIPSDTKFWKVENYLTFLEQREKNIIEHLNRSIKKLDIKFDRVLQQRIEEEKISTEKNTEIIRSLAAYKAQLKRKQENPQKFGDITEELLEKIKNLKLQLKEQ